MSGTAPDSSILSIGCISPSTFADHAAESSGATSCGVVAWLFSVAVLALSKGRASASELHRRRRRDNVQIGTVPENTAIGVVESRAREYLRIRPRRRGRGCGVDPCMIGDNIGLQY